MQKHMIYLWCSLACVAPVAAAPNSAEHTRTSVVQEEQQQDVQNEELDSEDFFAQAPDELDDSATSPQWRLYVATALDKTSEAAQTTYSKMSQAVGWLYAQLTHLWEKSDNGDDQ